MRGWPRMDVTLPDICTVLLNSCESARARRRGGEWFRGASQYASHPRSASQAHITNREPGGSDLHGGSAESVAHTLLLEEKARTFWMVPGPSRGPSRMPVFSSELEGTKKREGDDATIRGGGGVSVGQHCSCGDVDRRRQQL